MTSRKGMLKSKAAVAIVATACIIVPVFILFYDFNLFSSGLRELLAGAMSLLVAGVCLPGMMWWGKNREVNDQLDGIVVSPHPAGVMLAISFAMSFVFAATFVVILTWSLPPTDGAYGQKPFQDPLVLPIMSLGASIAGLAVFPFFYLAIRKRPLTKSVLIIVVAVLAEMAALTPFDIRAGMFGAWVAFAAGLIVARMATRESKMMRAT